MKVIGAGFPRTGTMSLKQALNILGYNSYHMEEVPKNEKKGHLEMWHQYVLKEAPMDWNKVFEGYDATTDFPAAYYYKELFQAYPDAKVVLGIRNDESWYRSINMLTQFSKRLKSMYFFPRIRQFGNFTVDQFDLVFGKWSKENFLKAYHRHNEEVQKFVPEGKLLVFNPKDGWQPLCEFLNKPIPDQPFPHANSGVNTLNKLLKKAMVRTLAKPIILVIGLLIAFLIWKMLG